MNTLRTFAIGLIATAAVTAVVPAQSLAPEQLARADFAQRLHAYVAMKESVRQTVLPLMSLSDPAEIRRRIDDLATVIRSARSEARQGDIVTPQMALLMRGAIRDGCEGDYAALLALIREEYDGALPAAAIHGRWRPAIPVPTMVPGILAALPPLPEGLQYRFMNNALVLIDIDANLIIDVVPDAIPITTENDHAS